MKPSSDRRGVVRKPGLEGHQKPRLVSFLFDPPPDIKYETHPIV